MYKIALMNLNKYIRHKNHTHLHLFLEETIHTCYAEFNVPRLLHYSAS